MTILQALYDKNNLLRIEHGNRWLVSSAVEGEWVVLECKRYHSKVREIIRTRSQHKAVEALLEG